MNTFTIKTNCSREEVWDFFSEKRKEGRNPILMDSVLGWTYVAIPKEIINTDESPNFLREFEQSLELEPELDSDPDAPPFIGGLLGFFSYEYALEKHGISISHKSLVPHLYFVYTEEVWAFLVVSESKCELPKFQLPQLKPNLSFEEYDISMNAMRDLLFAGENYQLCFTQDFTTDFEGDAFELYKALFQINPVEYAVFMEHPDFTLISNSPELLISKRGNKLRSEPIKGTVPRNSDPEILLKDPKVYSELIMIVDLLRNDLGRVADYGSVHVSENMSLMALKNVWHTYSVIEANLRADLLFADAFESVFPGGSVTGCPKLRAMQNLAKLENYARGAYCGSFGYLSLNGNADFNIMIRSGTLSKGVLHFPGGSGVLADSSSESEYREILQKVQGLFSLLN